MKKEKVTFNQLVYGALLKFGKLDSVDLSLLMVGISSKVEVVHNDFDYMNNYFVLVDGTVIFNEEYVRQFSRIKDKELLEKMQGSIVKEYMDNLKISEFVLRKIKLLGNGCVVKDGLEESFSDIQMKAISYLYKNGFIEDYLHKDSINGDYLAVKMTQKGNVTLFILDNREDVNAFIYFLRKVGYDNDFIMEFFRGQDLEKSCLEVLNIENFEAFCNKNNEHSSLEVKYRRRIFPEK